MNNEAAIASAKGLISNPVLACDVLSHDLLVEIGNIARTKGHLELKKDEGAGKQAESYNCRLEHAPFLLPIVFSAYHHILGTYGFDVSLDLTQQFLLNEYTGPSGEYPWHWDMSSQLMSDLKVTYIINASVDKYEGGHFHLAHGNLNSTHVPHLDKPGSGILFRANTLHKVDPVISGKRRSLVFFFEGPSWR